jgi:hypothetical protein
VSLLQSAQATEVLTIKKKHLIDRLTRNGYAFMFIGGFVNVQRVVLRIYPFLEVYIADAKLRKGEP